MALRWCALLALFGYALAQSGMELDSNDTLGTRFDGSLAEGFRAQHFYCGEQETNEEDFPTENTWSMLIQYPVLSYLDSSRKTILVQQIIRLINAGSTGTDLTTDNICIGAVTQYQVTYYSESVFIIFYFRDTTRTSDEINTAFRNAYMDSSVDGPSTDPLIVRQFLEGSAIFIDPVNAADSDLIGIDMNIHPGSVELEDSVDPTMNAVVINSLPGTVTIDMIINENLIQGFVQNPNPLNFGLEAGDIVFAVFGTILLFLLVVLVLVGFCIHPFFFG